MSKYDFLTQQKYKGKITLQDIYAGVCGNCSFQEKANKWFELKPERKMENIKGSVEQQNHEIEVREPDVIMVDEDADKRKTSSSGLRFPNKNGIARGKVKLKRNEEKIDNRNSIFPEK